MYTYTMYVYLIQSIQLRVRIPLSRGVQDITLCDSLSATCGRSVVSSTNKTDRHDLTEILLKVALNTINLTPIHT
jgi:hypothetical protein